MKRIGMGLAVAGALAATAAQETNAAILISEVCYNEVGSDTTGEWVEIWNTGSAPVDISGYKFGDEETQNGDSVGTEAGGMWQFPTGTTLAAGDVIVVAVNATRFNTVYGFLPDFETGNTDAGVPEMVAYTTWVNPAEPNNMSNTSDQAVLLGPTDAIADMASWGNTFAFNPGLGATVLDGQSYRRTTNIDTNTAGDWELSPDTGVAATRSSPGVVTAAVPEPASASLLALGAAALLVRRRR